VQGKNNEAANEFTGFVMRITLLGGDSILTWRFRRGQKEKEAKDLSKRAQNIEKDGL
jgi:hypothetical protein